MFTESDNFPGADTMNAGAIGDETFLSMALGGVACRKEDWWLGVLVE